MLLGQIYDYLKEGKLHDYPLITFEDENGLTISTDQIKYKDLELLKHYNYEWIGTWLPFTIKMMCDFRKLGIEGAHL